MITPEQTIDWTTRFMRHLDHDLNIGLLKQDEYNRISAKILELQNRAKEQLEAQDLHDDHQLQSELRRG